MWGFFLSYKERIPTCLPRSGIAKNKNQHEDITIFQLNLVFFKGYKASLPDTYMEKYLNILLNIILKNRILKYLKKYLYVSSTVTLTETFILSTFIKMYLWATTSSS